MNLLYIPADIEALMNEILIKLKIHMNGELAESLTNAGISYKKNYGVNYIHLKQIAKAYSPNYQLAKALWAKHFRETMILAAMLMPIKEFKQDDAKEWIKEIKHNELAEQLSMILFCKLDFAKELAIEWSESADFWTKVTGIILSARVYDQFSDQETELFLKSLLTNAHTDNIHLYKSIALSLSRFCRKDNNTAHQIKAYLDQIRSEEGKGISYIVHEVNQELYFLEII